MKPWEVIRFRLVHEGGTFMIGLVPLEADESRSPSLLLTPPPSLLPSFPPSLPLSTYAKKRHYVSTQCNGGCLQASNGQSPITEYANTLILNFQSLEL